LNITIVIPVFNAETRLKRAVQSALDQKEVDEVILVDDGSKDNSFQLILNLKKKDDRIKVLSHEGRLNKGPAATRNLGIEHAKNEYVAFLDADDFYLQNRFQEAVSLLTADNTLDGVYCKCGVVSEWMEGELIQSRIEEKIIGFNELIPPENLFFSFSPIGHKGRFNTNSILVRKNKIKEAKYFDINLRIGEDVMLYLKLAIIAKLTGVNEVLCYRSKHEDNITAQANGDYTTYLYELFKQLALWPHPLKKAKHQFAFIDQMLFHAQRVNKIEVIILYLKFILKNPGFYSINWSRVHLKRLILL
jgi:glycosyltransferase involved in cell wall biosynthesis